MNKILSSLFLVGLLSQPALAQTCEDFNDKGTHVESFKELLTTSTTLAQAEDFKVALAKHASKLTSRWMSPKKKAFDLVREQNQFAFFARETLAMTRAKCFLNPSSSLNTVVSENFDTMLDAVVERHSL